MRLISDEQWSNIEEPAGHHFVLERVDVSMHVIRRFVDDHLEGTWSFYAPDMLRTTTVRAVFEESKVLRRLSGWDVVRVLDDAFQSMDPRRIEEAMYTVNSWLTVFTKERGRTGNAEFVEEYIEGLLDLLIHIETNS